MNTDGLKEALASVVRAELPDVNVLSVELSAAEGAEGEPVLDMTVVFEAKSELDASKVAGMLRHMRPVLDQYKERRFPIMSFVTKRDAEKMGFEAA